MNDAQSTVVGLKAQDCPGGGWTGQPPTIYRATVADCLAHGVCGCIYGDAVKHIERLEARLQEIRDFPYVGTAASIRIRGIAGDALGHGRKP